MRDPARIDVVLDLLHQARRANPDLPDRFRHLVLTGEWRTR